MITRPLTAGSVCGELSTLLYRYIQVHEFCAILLRGDCPRECPVHIHVNVKSKDRKMAASSSPRTKGGVCDWYERREQVRASVHNLTGPAYCSPRRKIPNGRFAKAARGAKATSHMFVFTISWFASSVRGLILHSFIQLNCLQRDDSNQNEGDTRSFVCCITIRRE